MSCVVNFEYDFVEEDSGTSLLRNLSEHHTSELNGGFHNNIHIMQVWDRKWTNLVGQY